MRPQTSTESGNILFLILIAVVLFAALMFAVTQTERGGDNVNQDNIRIAASQLTQSGVDVESAVLRLRISKALNEADISFETPGLSGHTHPGCLENRCKVFTPEGGQISYNRPREDWLNRAFITQPHYGEWLYTGTACVPGIGSGNDATCNTVSTQLDLIAILPWVTKDLCIEINRRIGVPLNNGNPPQLTGSGWSGSEDFTGVFPSSGEAIIDGGNLLFGHAEGCFEGNGTPPAGSHHYYRVVLPR